MSGAAVGGVAGFASTALLITGIGIAAYKATEFLMELTGASEGLGNMLHSLIGDWEQPIKAGTANSVQGVREKVAAGTLTKEQGAKEIARIEGAAASSKGTNVIASSVAGELIKSGAITKEQAEATLNNGGKGNQKVAALARRIAEASYKGKDVSADMKELVKLIGGKEVVLKVDGNTLAKAALNSLFQRLQ
jgi:hypothetical protein